MEAKFSLSFRECYFSRMPLFCMTFHENACDEIESAKERKT